MSDESTVLLIIIGLQAPINPSSNIPRENIPKRKINRFKLAIKRNLAD